MPQRKGTRGYYVHASHNPYTPKGEVELDFIGELAQNPAWREIVAAGYELQRMGFDLGDPDIWARAVTTGERDYAEHAEYEAETAARRAETVHQPIVYYMRLGNLVKIGTTTNLAQRYKAIGPQSLMAIEFGGTSREKARHREFADHREHGEWFRIEGALAEHVAAIRSELERATGQPFADWLADALPVRIVKVTGPIVEEVVLDRSA